MYHPETIKIFKKLTNDLGNLKGYTIFKIGEISINVTGRDGLGGLIEEWFGVWAKQTGFQIKNPKEEGKSQEFPDFYIGKDNSLLEIKTFDADRSPNFDLANFESYCDSLAKTPERIDSDYLIFAYKLNGKNLSITNIWLKKIWEISCPSERYPLKTQVKRNVIYNIRPATWYSKNPQYKVFNNKEEFIEALFETQRLYRGESNKDLYLSKVKSLKEVLPILTKRLL
ncbi:restriction endonuclease [Candidatus Peregrinibacteria bacterium HGW-Peregrinibacteria-1]|jgi:type II restriction enzyme|nr:MAG: restriction endonuclease [Candidatus Peregrinibacteria bacterium HGW-Peregrinibacteria-1]